MFSINRKLNELYCLYFYIYFLLLHFSNSIRPPPLPPKKKNLKAQVMDDCFCIESPITSSLERYVSVLHLIYFIYESIKKVLNL